MIGVFGSSGFIGRHLVDHLRRFGIPHRALSRASSPGFDFADATTYRGQLEGLSSVVLLVSATFPGTADLAGEVEQNVLPHARFLAALRESGVRRVVYLSSGGTIYGNTDVRLIPESHPLRPVSPYGCGKLMIENLIQTAASSADWTYAILRPANPVGRFQSIFRRQGIVASALKHCLAGTPIEIWGDGSIVRDYFDVQHLVDAILDMTDNKADSNEIVNVGSGHGMSINEVLTLVEETVGRPIARNYVHNRSIDTPFNVLDGSHLHTLTGRNIPPLDHGTVEEVRQQIERATPPPDVQAPGHP